MNWHAVSLLLAGAAATMLIGFTDAMGPGARMIGRLQNEATGALAQAGAGSVRATFLDEHG